MATGVLSSTAGSEHLMQEKILFVDDEVQVLEGYRRLLHTSFQIETASSGADALKKLKNSKQFAVVVCDMRMPEMDGAHLLHTIMLDFPEVVRIMLTGNSDQQTAIDAVNQGNIFRFLTKPCSKDDLSKTLNAALIQYRMTKNKENLLDSARYGHRLDPWTADPSSEAFREVEEKVHELVGNDARTVQPSEGGIYLGKIVWSSTDYVLQTLSPARVVVHPRNLLSEIPDPGELVRIEYNNGSAEVIRMARR